MPRFRNLFDYSTNEDTHRPRETLIDIPVTDSVKVITLHFEDSGTVQIRRKPLAGDDGEIDGNTSEYSKRYSNDWEVITSFDTIKKMKGSSYYAR